jgi:threonine dehydrogenase-like Zn-dependent dehydrogenase
MAEYLAVPARSLVPTGAISLDDTAMIEFLAIGRHGIRWSPAAP